MHKQTNKKNDDHRWSPCQSQFASFTSGMPSQDNQDWKKLFKQGAVQTFEMYSWGLTSAICWLNKHYSETNRSCLHSIPLQPYRFPEYQSVTAAKWPAKGSKSFFDEANENMQMDSTTERGKLTGGTWAHYALSNASSRLFSASPQTSCQFFTMAGLRWNSKAADIVCRSCWQTCSFVPWAVLLSRKPCSTKLNSAQNKTHAAPQETRSS